MKLVDVNVLVYGFRADAPNHSQYLKWWEEQAASPQPFGLADPWGIFVNLCRKTNARGNLIPDAFLAALAIESGSNWIKTDRDYARFPDLHWQHPLEF